MKIVKILMNSFLILLIIVFAISCNSNEKKELNAEVLKLGNKVPPIKFNAENAFKHIQKQLSFGPRVPNSQSAENCKIYLANELSKFTKYVEIQSFNILINGENLKLNNIIAKFNPNSKKRIILCAHWDTRPWADEDPEPNNHTKPIPGANDGASGVGILLELAAIITQLNLPYGVDIVLFDGEDYGTSENLENYSLGSQYFASSLQNPEIYKYGILLDLVGDKEAIFKKEKFSILYAEDFTNLVWERALTKNINNFRDEHSTEIIDDHLPLNKVGIKTINIIDAELVGQQSLNPRRKYWHTLKDDISNLSTETLQNVGNLLVDVLYNLKF